jgi:hypothetical protein
MHRLYRLATDWEKQHYGALTGPAPFIGDLVS